MADTALWQTVLGEMELSLSKAHFETWLRNTKLRSLEDDRATVIVPNIFIKSWVEKNYTAQIITSFQKHGAIVNEIDYVIDGSAEPATEALPERVPTKERTNTKQPERPANNIRHNQTFETFIEGSANRLAFAVSRNVAQNPGKVYNPLFIYGGVGLGKTHLLNAIANEVVKHDPEKKTLYTSCEQFTNDYVTSISTKKTDKFKQTYRTVDVLLVDDIQFLANKEGSQEEFFNTFNTLHQSNRQIIIAADRPPKSIPGLEERLTSRFGWGMVVDIQPPNLETRLAILTSKCAEKNIKLTDDALEYIAREVKSNIRELEGALNRVILYCETTRTSPTLEAARAALSGLIVPNSRQSYSADVVLQTAADHFSVNLADLIGKKRNAELVYSRHVTMYILRDVLDMSYPEIGREMGGKDHTTVIHGVNKVSSEMENNGKIQRDISAIKDKIASRH